jgi:hypothetical protein
MDDTRTPSIDHTTTMRANILRGFFDRSQTKSPVKPSPASPQPQPPQGYSPFLDMIRSKRGFISTSQPPKDVETQGEVVGRMEDDVASTKPKSHLWQMLK